MSQPEVPSTAAVPSSPARPNCSFNGLELRSCVSGEAFPDRQSRAVGVPSIGRRLSGSAASKAFLIRCSASPFVVGVSKVRSDGLTFPTRPAPPPWFDPYSVALGVGSSARRSVARSRFGFPLLPCRPRLPPASDASGVDSDKPHALPLVRGADIVSTHHERPAGVAESLQFNEEPVDASSSEARAVLKSAPTRPALSDDADGLEEQAGALAVDAAALGVRGAGVLAWGGADDDIGEADAIGNKSSCPEGSHVIVEPRVGEVPAEDGAAPRVDFAGGDGSEAGAVQAERPAATCAAE
jgi:hypothetical protein